MNVLPRSSLPRSRSTTTDPRDSGTGRGSWASTTWAEAKNRLPYAASMTISPPGRIVGDGPSHGYGEFSSNVHRVTVTLLDWWTTKSTIEIATPVITAYCSGMTRVSTNVVTMTVAWRRPVRHTSRIRSGLAVTAGARSAGRRPHRQRSARHRAADRHALQQARGDVAHALTPEVARSVGVGAVRVRHRLADRRSLTK